MLESVDEILYGRPFLGASLAVLALQLVALVVAARRGRRGAWPAAPLRLHLWAGAAILILPAFAGVSVHAARATMLQAMAGGDPSDKARALSAGIAGQLNAIPFAATTTVLALLLWLPGMKLAMDAPRPGRAPRPFPRAALVAFGLVFVWIGAIKWSVHVIRTFAAMAGIAPEEKAALALRELDVARAQLQSFAHVAGWTIAAMTALAIGLTLHERRARGVPPGAAPDARSARWFLGAAAVALALAAGLVAAARPMRTENALPWPPLTPGGQLGPSDIVTPELEGPDLLELAPVVFAAADRLLLDGAPCDPESLEDKLLTLRTNFQLLHPGDSFNGGTVVVADAALPVPRLISVLRTIKLAGYGKPRFAFTRPESMLRPTFGKVERVRATAVEATLVDADDVEASGDEKGGADGVLVRPQAFRTYADLARQMVAVRGRGAPVVLGLPQVSSAGRSR